MTTRIIRLTALLIALLTPLAPASRPSQVDCTSPPRGVVAPRPVITTSMLLMGVSSRM